MATNSANDAGFWNPFAVKDEALLAQFQFVFDETLAWVDQSATRLTSQEEIHIVNTSEVNSSSRDQTVPRLSNASQVYVVSTVGVKEVPVVEVPTPRLSTASVHEEAESCSSHPQRRSQCNFQSDANLVQFASQDVAPQRPELLEEPAAETGLAPTHSFGMLSLSEPVNGIAFNRNPSHASVHLQPDDVEKPKAPGTLLAQRSPQKSRITWKMTGRALRKQSEAPIIPLEDSAASGVPSKEVSFNNSSRISRSPCRTSEERITASSSRVTFSSGALDFRNDSLGRGINSRTDEDAADVRESERVQRQVGSTSLSLATSNTTVPVASSEYRTYEDYLRRRTTRQTNQSIGSERSQAGSLSLAPVANSKRSEVGTLALVNPNDRTERQSKELDKTGSVCPQSTDEPVSFAAPSLSLAGTTSRANTASAALRCTRITEHHRSLAATIAKASDPNAISEPAELAESVALSLSRGPASRTRGSKRGNDENSANRRSLAKRSKVGNAASKASSSTATPATEHADVSLPVNASRTHVDETTAQFCVTVSAARVLTADKDGPLPYADYLMQKRQRLAMALNALRKPDAKSEGDVTEQVSAEEPHKLPSSAQMPQSSVQVVVEMPSRRSSISPSGSPAPPDLMEVEGNPSEIKQRLNQCIQERTGSINQGPAVEDQQLNLLINGQPSEKVSAGTKKVISENKAENTGKSVQAPEAQQWQYVACAATANEAPMKPAQQSQELSESIIESGLSESSEKRSSQRVPQKSMAADHQPSKSGARRSSARLQQMQRGPSSFQAALVQGGFHDHSSPLATPGTPQPARRSALQKDGNAENRKRLADPSSHAEPTAQSTPKVRRKLFTGLKDSNRPPTPTVKPRGIIEMTAPKPSSVDADLRKLESKEREEHAGTVAFMPKKPHDSIQSRASDVSKGKRPIRALEAAEKAKREQEEKARLRQLRHQMIQDKKRKGALAVSGAPISGPGCAQSKLPGPPGTRLPLPGAATAGQSSAISTPSSSTSSSGKGATNVPKPKMTAPVRSGGLAGEIRPAAVPASSKFTREGVTATPQQKMCGLKPNFTPSRHGATGPFMSLYSPATLARDEGLFELCSEEEDMVSKKVPDWAQGERLNTLVQAQVRTDPDRVFGSVKPLPLEEVFERKFRVTATPEAAPPMQLHADEVLEYSRHMRYQA